MSNRAIALSLLIACTPATGPAPSPVPAVPAGRNVIVVVWDGLRPDAITAGDTPNLARLRDAGVEFRDQHATYPTFTMMNAASFATGAFPDATGFYGNVVWQPTATGHDAAGAAVDFRQPVFSEDYAVLDALKQGRPQLMRVDTLFAAAQAAGMTTLAVGKTGAAYLQDNARGGRVLDEKTVLPREFAAALQAAGVALPATAPHAYADGDLVLGPDNGTPTEFAPQHRLGDGVSSDPTDTSGSPYKHVLDYLVTTYLDHVLPQHQPRLTVVWLRDPDTTEHNYGIGSANWRDALRANDLLLGRLVGALDALGRRATTDLLIVSDHGHSNVSGPQSLFPLRAVAGGAIGAVDPRGHSVSGLIRLADLLRRAGFTAYDGLGCTDLPGGTGLRGDGSAVYFEQIDADGTQCAPPGKPAKPGQRYQALPSKVPAELPPGALVVAVNGGSDYVYVPDHDPAVVARTVRFLQERGEIGAIFIDDRYGALPGTLALGAIHARNAEGRNPDLIVSYDYDPDAVIEGTPGTELAGMLNGGSYRGMHGSFSPRDVHNVLIGSGPDFRAGFRDPLPTGNVDVAPTVAYLLGLRLPHAQGRPLLEALAHGAAIGDYHVTPGIVRPAAPATGLTVRLPTDPDGKAIAPGLTTYTSELHTQAVTYGDRTYTYFDFAKATRGTRPRVPRRAAPPRGRATPRGSRSEDDRLSTRGVRLRTQVSGANPRADR